MVKVKFYIEESFETVRWYVGYENKGSNIKMEMFFITFKQMLLMFSLMLLGYILRKKSIIPENFNALIAFATPLGLNTIIYPAAYGGDTKTGASMAMVSHTLSVITIPFMYFVFIVLL